MSLLEGQTYIHIEPASSLRVVEVNPQADPRWETLVHTHCGAQVYHQPAWLQVLEEAFGYQAAHLGCEDADGQLRGILPLFYNRGLFTGRQFSSLPRTPFAGPLAYDDRATAILVQAAVQRTREKSGATLQLKTLAGGLDGLAEGIVGGPWRETYVVELPERPELLHLGNTRSNAARIRWAINKATRFGVEVQPAETTRDLRAWYQLYLDTMRQVVVPPRPYRFFEIAWQQLYPRGLMRLLLAKRYEAGRARVLAGTLYLLSGQTICCAFNGRSRQDLALRPNDALHWHAIHDACVEGFRHYDFGEVTRDNTGLALYKGKWGAETRQLYRYYYPEPSEREINMLESTSPAHQLAAAAWRRLPLKATSLLSTWAHRSF